MTGLEARDIIEAELRRELFGPISGDGPQGNPIDCSKGSIHFTSVEASRGQFHDAIATDDDSLHITFSVQVPMGLTLIQDMALRLIDEPAFRADLPRLDGPDGEAALRSAWPRRRQEDDGPRLNRARSARTGGHIGHTLERFRSDPGASLRTGVRGSGPQRRATIHGVSRGGA